MRYKVEQRQLLDLVIQWKVENLMGGGSENLCLVIYLRLFRDLDTTKLHDIQK